MGSTLCRELHAEHLHIRGSGRSRVPNRVALRVSLSLVTEYKRTLVVSQPTAVSEHLSAFDLASAQGCNGVATRCRHMQGGHLSQVHFLLCAYCALHPMVVEPIGRVRAADEPIAHGLA